MSKFTSILSLSAALALAACGQGEQTADGEHDAKQAAGHEGGAKVHWDYDGDEGPENWAKLSDEFATCAVGKQQSPIDLPSPDKAKTIDVSTDYASSEAEIVNNGHTIQANIGGDFTLTSGDMKYKLLQVHMHTPSEHKIAGESAPMVAHFVHASEDKKYAVLGILFEEGDANPAIQNIIDNVDGKTSLDLTAMLPDTLKAINYTGSLTTPPCTEGVNWHVVMQPVEASEEQIEKLHDIMDDNARPVQPLHDRKLGE